MPTRDWHARLNIWGAPWTPSFFVVLDNDTLYITETNHGRRQVRRPLPEAHYQELLMLWRAAMRSQIPESKEIADGTNIRLEVKNGRQSPDVVEFRKLKTLEDQGMLSELVAELNKCAGGIMEIY